MLPILNLNPTYLLVTPWPSFAHGPSQCCAVFEPEENFRDTISRVLPLRISVFAPGPVLPPSRPALQEKSAMRSRPDCARPFTSLPAALLISLSLLFWRSPQARLRPARGNA